ncbi:hypothetical protein GCM10011511_25420 [Puia dinghuensis]|uniref:Uncharacterized protein n=1 Tax=Puia dinghuensis TaxID=1792502 RepID=A0A8J2XTQ2_9BACT|nr:hypothetical protein GCM10011511_25420 [Puia dinghuensis]
MRDFVSFAIRNERGAYTPFILEDSVSAGHGSEFLAGCLNDTATFTPDERQQIRAWASHPPFRVWTTELVPDARLIQKDTIVSIFSNRHRDGWAYFYSHVGQSFNTFGCPLFLRNYTWCIFYAGSHCGWLCGGGRLALYKKDGDNWVFVKDWGSWVS